MRVPFRGAGKCTFAHTLVAPAHEAHAAPGVQLLAATHAAAPKSPAPCAAASVADAACAAAAYKALTKVCDDFWQGWLKVNPTQATVLGDHRYDDRLGDISPEAKQRERTRVLGVQA